MTGNVWHKRYHGDALNGYMGLTLEQRGAYTTILDLLYDSGWEVGIPDRERWIAGHLNVSVRRWRGLRDELIAAGKIDIIDGQISNFRYRKERENAASLSRKRSESGASGGEKSGETRRKAAENRHSGEANASDLPLYARASEAELDTEVEKSVAKATQPLRGFSLPDDIPKDAWDGFLEMRKRKRANPTDRAKGGIVKKLRALAEAGHPPGEVLDQSTNNNWTDVYPIKDTMNGTARNGNGQAGGSGDGFIDAIREARANREARGRQADDDRGMSYFGGMG